MSGNLNQVEAIFSEALAKSNQTERAEYLDRACSNDPALRQSLDELLASHEAAREFLQLPQAEVDTSSFRFSEAPGAKVGHYRLLEQIGEGGFGVVFLAEQEEPVRRRVAIKIIKLGMDTKQVVARFEAERQALAMMDHPNIARVLDAGTTETGRPYFVMTLVKGIPITRYCDDNQLGLGERLNLFMSVCAAVQHAHQKGIIHRDLKPNNVLVTLQDDKPVPKIIDFGIAKATQFKLTERTLFTESHQLIGTPTYMSPEQAQMSGLDIDTRSDIYSLGVLLYELLTGTTPFDTQHLTSVPFAEMQRIIREVDPPPPSSRLTTLGADQQTTAASNRDSDPNRIRKALQGDLDWIIMRCLEKDRTRRYATANSLAADLQRYLNDEPVEARRPTRWYRLHKFVRRNKIGAVATFGILAAMALGLGIASVGFLQAHRQAARSDQVAIFLKEMLQAAGPSVARGRDTTLMQEILDKTSQRIGNDLNDQPQVQAELRSIIGNTYFALGRYHDAEVVHRLALETRQATLGKNHPDTAASLHDLALVHELQGKYELAETLHREALEIRIHIYGEEHPDVARSMADLAETLRLRGTSYRAESENLQRRALAMRRKLFGSEHLEVALSLEKLGMLIWTRFDAKSLSEAESLQREALAIRRKLLGNDHLDVATSLDELGLALIYQGRATEAEQVEREALAIDRKWLGNDHRDISYRLHNLATSLKLQGKLEEAESSERESLSIRRKALGDHRDVANSLSNLGRILQEEGKLAEAESVYGEELDLALRINHPIIDPLVELTALLQQQKKFDQAEKLYRQAIAAREANAPNAWDVFDCRVYLGLFLLGRERFAEAEPLFVTACNGLNERENQIPPPYKVHLTLARQHIVHFYEAWDRAEPGHGHDKKAIEYRNKLAAASPKR